MEVDSEQIPYSNEVDTSSLLAMRFPQKLWKIVNECQTAAIQWSTDGTAIILDYAKFQKEYLETRTDIFKTSNITSFIRQLNLYGFRKVSHHYRESYGVVQNPDIHEFRNSFFCRGRYDLLTKVTRKTTGSVKTRIELRRIAEEPRNSRLKRCQMALQNALHRQQQAFVHSTPGGSKIQIHHWNNKVPAMQDSSSESSSSSSSSNTSSEDSDAEINVETIKKKQPSWAESTKIKTEMDVPPKKRQRFLASVKPPKRSEMTRLLDPSTPPEATVSSSESFATLEESLTLDSVFSQMDRNLSEKIYHMLMADDANKENIDSSLLHYGGINIPPRQYHFPTPAYPTNLVQHMPCHYLQAAPPMFSMQYRATWEKPTQMALQSELSNQPCCCSYANTLPRI